jgi:hypothetical protein
VALRSFLRFAAREEWLPGDLGTTIDVPKLPERLPKPLKPPTGISCSMPCPTTRFLRSGIER